MSRYRKSAIIVFRATPEEALKIKQLATDKQTTVSKYVRDQLIWSYDFVVGSNPSYRQLSMALERFLNSTDSGKGQGETTDKSLVEDEVRRGGNE